MNWINFYRFMQLALGFMALVVTLDLPRVQAQPTIVVSGLHFIPPQPPDEGAAGGKRRGGASRCVNCPVLQLTALVPGDSQENAVLALTADEHPTFWVYVPQVLTSKLSGEFVLQDAADNYVYKTYLTIPKTSDGVVSVVLPQNTAPLEVGKQYHWTFLIHSDPQTSTYVAVDGLVKRVVPDAQLLNDLKRATPRERTALYAAHGIWYDALTNLAGLRRQNPQDAAIAADWTSLLHSVGLDNVVTKPETEFRTQQSDGLQ